MPKKIVTVESQLQKETEKKFIGFCPTCHRTCQILTKEAAKAKKSGIKTKSAKAKGRHAQQQVMRMILEAFGLDQEDVESTGMGQTGKDIRLTKAARERFPFHAIEVTASPNVSLMGKYKQAQRHAEPQLAGKEPGNGRPILVFKKNGTELFAMIAFSDLLAVLQEKEGFSKPREGEEGALAIH